MVKSNLIAVLSAAVLFGNTAVLAADNVTEKKQPISGKHVSKKHTSSLSVRTSELEHQVELLKNQIGLSSGRTAPVELYAHGPAIVSSPTFGFMVRPQAQELMVQLSKINRDLYLLKLRQKMDRYASEHGIRSPNAPVIAVSGGVEGRFTYNDNYDYSKSSKGDIDLERAEVDITGEIGPWVTAAMIFAYDKAAGYSSPIFDNISVTKYSNSRLQIDRAFLTFGQLEKCPFYFSIGQHYAPFGNYGSFMVTSPSTKILGRTKDRMVILGYSQYGIDTQIYGLSGSTSAIAGSSAASSEIIKHGGIDINYIFARDNFKMRIGAGVLGNLAESEGMQTKVFSNSTASETIYSRVLGYNGNVKFGYYDFDLLAEYVGASTAFDSRDLPFNGNGARPQAFNVEGAYSFKIKDKLNTVFAGYGTTRQSLSLGLPKNTYFAGYTVELIKNTLASIEYRHDVNYGWNNNTVAWTAGEAGRHSNTVTVQLGAYF